MENELIGKRIKRARKLANMTQDNLAQRLFISRTCLSNYEGNRRTIPLAVIQGISEILEVSMDYLIGRESIPKTMQQISEQNYQLEKHLTNEGHLNLSKDSILIKMMTIEYYLFIKEKASAISNELQY